MGAGLGIGGHCAPWKRSSCLPGGKARAGNAPKKSERWALWEGTGPAPHTGGCSLCRKTSLVGVGGSGSLTPCPLPTGWNVPDGAQPRVPHPSLVLKASLFHGTELRPARI